MFTASPTLTVSYGDELQTHQFLSGTQPVAKEQVFFRRLRHKTKKLPTFKPTVEGLEERLVMSAVPATQMGPTAPAAVSYMSQPSIIGHQFLSGTQPVAKDQMFFQRLGQGAVTPAAGSSTLPFGLSPSQVSHAYGFDQISFNNGTVKGDGTGQTIAIIDVYDQPNIASDLAVFDAMYGLPAPPSFTKVDQHGGTNYPAVDAKWGLETSLDVEWAHAMAPGANILLVEANSTGWSDLLTAVNYARQQPGVSVVSMSWGGAEFSLQSHFDSYFTTPTGHGGVTFVASTGDDGSAGGIEYVSSSPNVLAVGGTALNTDSVGNYLGETAWSGSGGGISAYTAQPAYQKGVVTQSSTMRGVADVSYAGSSSTPFAVYDTSVYSGWLQSFGTSAGAPQWAALVAVANQGRALAGQDSLDGATQTLPKLYQLPSSYFHDITTGSNGAFSAGAGYDLVTGLGTPRADLIASGLIDGATTTTTRAATTTTTTTQAPTVVTPASATTTMVTGTTTGLSVLGSSTGATGLTCTWSVVGTPTGATTPTFSVNGTNAAQNTTVTFSMAGTYTFQATLTDSSGLTTTSTVTVTVNQTLSKVTVTPGIYSLANRASVNITATALDQFGNAMSTQSGWTLALATGSLGTLTDGLYTAPISGKGQATITATCEGVTGSAVIKVGSTPVAASNLTATSSATQQVNLTWQNNAGNATGFIIQRYSAGIWTKIAKVAATVTDFTDTKVVQGKTYSYRVFAYNSYGHSAASNVAKVVAANVKAAVGLSTPAAAQASLSSASAGSDNLPGDSIKPASSRLNVLAGSLAENVTGRSQENTSLAPTSDVWSAGEHLSLYSGTQFHNEALQTLATTKLQQTAGDGSEAHDDLWSAFGKTLDQDDGDTGPG